MLNIEKNYHDFIRYLKAYITRDGAENLIYWLENGTDIKTSPASTKYHMSCEGGLIAHSLQVFYNLIKLLDIAKQTYPTIQTYSKETIAIVALLHDIGKVNTYKTVMKNVKDEASGKWVQVASYTLKDDDERFIYSQHAENSVFILKDFIGLTYEEALAIRYHMGIAEDTDNFASQRMMSAYKKSPLAFYLHMADMQSMLLDETTDDYKKWAEEVKEESTDGESSEQSDKSINT